MTQILTTTDHNRTIAGLKYLYPVMSRRAGGLSIGVNFNPNNACNWRCIYCQVPDLQRGNAPEMDFALLEHELRSFLAYVQQGSFFADFNVEPSQQVIKDIAISGNGESTSLKQFDRAVNLIGTIATEAGVFPSSKFVLISNGSLIHQAPVQAGLKALNSFGGELWFKLDSATEQGRKLINNTGQSQAKLVEHLTIASRLCTTRLQTCILHYQTAWSDSEKQAYLDLLKQLKQQNIAIKDVMLYSVARQSFQPEATQITSATLDELNQFAKQIQALGYPVSVSP